jgi:hypothetical protein
MQKMLIHVVFSEIQHASSRSLSTRGGGDHRLWEKDEDLIQDSTCKRRGIASCFRITSWGVVRTQLSSYIVSRCGGASCSCYHTYKIAHMYDWLAWCLRKRRRILIRNIPEILFPASLRNFPQWNRLFRCFRPFLIVSALFSQRDNICIEIGYTLQILYKFPPTV